MNESARTELHPSPEEMRLWGLGQGQTARSEQERALPEYMRNNLDRVRSGFKPWPDTGRISPDEQVRFLRAHLPVRK